MKHAILVSWLIIISFALFTITVTFSSRLSESAMTNINALAAAFLIISNIWAVVILRRVGKNK